jgi:dipeptidase
MISYTSDAGFQYGAMGHYPAADHVAGTMRDVFNEDSGSYSGQIPEAAHTYNAIAYHGGMNEHQLAISETTFGGLHSLGGQKGIIDYGSLMDLALQRCKTAREAITFMTGILAEYGYSSSGESFSIADTTEVWLMEVVSKGVGEKGVVWVARKVPDDGACSHANQARIRTWPRDDTSMWANDTISFAVKKGLYPKDADPLAFSFSDTFAPVDFAGARLGEVHYSKYGPRINCSQYVNSTVLALAVLLVNVS